MSRTHKITGPVETRVPCLNVSVEETHRTTDFRFGEPFCIGRDDDCQIRIEHPLVSRRHLEVIFEKGSWWIRDLRSSNGTYIDGARIDCVPLNRPVKLKLGKNGPTVSLQLQEHKIGGTEREPEAESDPSLSQYAGYYFGDAPGDTAGERTQMIRRAFEDVRSRQKKRYALVISAMVALLIFAGSYAVYQRSQVGRQQELAEEIFYAMKSLELELANTEQALLASKGEQALEEVQNHRERRREMEQSYDRFLQQTRFYSKGVSEEDRLILRMARVFGECELSMPSDFVAEVKKYIGRWQSSERLKRALIEASDKGYVRRIAAEMLAQGLPPQFFYLALQESNFDPYICGPITRKGIAKGVWQFIPETGLKYGLKIGPLFELRRPDPADERHNFEKATHAAARYLKFIYTTDAQASGLLVMASYNWGEERVIKLIRTLPANPRERNFWRLLAAYRDNIPQETYDYVFYIISAAAIGENPRLFGFDFENPLAHLEGKSAI